MKLNKILTFILVFVLMFTCVSINTLAEDNVAYLDLESTETYKNSKDLDQNYTYTQTGDVTYTDTTKVKLTWTINDIEATYTSHKTWDPANLQWVEAKEDINVTHSGASFTLTNYSSKSVIGTVSFEVESNLKDTFTSATFDDNNGKEIDTMVNADHTVDETKKTNVPSNTITATLAFNSDKFADLTAAASATKYGTYTVTIKKAKLTQTAPTAPDKANVTITSNSVTLTAAPAGQGDTKYGYSTTNDATKVENWQDGVEFTKLDANTTYYFFVKYEGDDDYKEAVSEGTEIKTAAAWKPLSATVQGSTVCYFPVLGGTNPQPDKFAYSTDGVTFTEIEKPDGGYTMTGDVVTYAKAGQLYYSGGSVNTVRSVNDISWDNTFKADSAISYPYHASTAYDDLQAGIKAKIASDGSEIVEKVAMEPSGEPTATPTINGVNLSDIWSAYNKMRKANGFGEESGVFLLSIAKNSTQAYIFGCYSSSINLASRSDANGTCVLVSRTFN